MKKNHILQTFGFLAIMSMILVPYANQSEAQSVIPCNDAVLTGTIAGEVLIDNEKFCIIHDAVVEENIVVNGDLMISDSTVKGNIDGENSGFVDIMFTTVEQNVNLKGKLVDIRHSQVDGNINLLESSQDLVVYDTIVSGDITSNKNTGTILISHNEVEQKILVTESTGPFILVEANNVSKDVLVSKNTGTILISTNDVEEKMEVTENAGSTILVDDNEVSKELLVIKSDGIVQVSNNEVTESLMVKDNSGPITNIDSNDVDKDASCESNVNVTGGGNMIDGDNKECPV